MTTAKRPMGSVPQPKYGSKADWTGAALAGLVALVIGIGVGWLMFRDAGVDIPSDVESLVNEYSQAWVDGDGDTAVSYMTDGARFVSDRYVADGGISGESLATHIKTSPVSLIEFGEITSIAGDLPYLVVRAGSVGDRQGFGVMYIVEDAGQLKIAYNSWHDYSA